MDGSYPSFYVFATSKTPIAPFQFQLLELIHCCKPIYVLYLPQLFDILRFNSNFLYGAFSETDFFVHCGLCYYMVNTMDPKASFCPGCREHGGARDVARRLCSEPSFQQLLG